MEKSDKRVLFYVTMVVLLLLLLFASSFLSMAVLKHHGQDLSNEQLHSDTSGVNRALVAKVEQEKSILQSLTQIIFQIKKENFSNEKKKEKYLAVMDNMENHCDFEEIAISHVDKNGIMQTLGNEILEGDIANCEYYLKAMKNDGLTVLRTVKSKLDESKTYIVLVVPFFADFGEFGEPELGAKAQGVLRGAYSYEKWEASLAELVTNDSFFRVVDKNGDIIVTTSKDDKTYYENLGQSGRRVENIFEDIFSFGKENVQAQMLAGGTGFATLSTPLGSYAACYEKLDFSGVWLNEWYVFSAIKSSYFTKLLDKPLKESIAIIVVMSLTITLLGIFVMYNISRNKKQLVESNLRLNNVIKYIGGGIFIYDIENNFKIIFANESAVTMYGYPLDEIKKFDVVQCLFEEDKAAYLKEIEKIKNEEITNFKIEYRIVRSDGTVCWMLENANVVMLDNKNRALQTIFVDIDNQKKLEQELVIKEQNYKLAVKIMGVKVFEYNLQRKKIKVFEHDNLQDTYILQRELTIDELIASENPHQDDCAKLKQAFEKIDAGAPIADCIIRTYDQDGKETINKVSMTAIIVDGVTLRAVGSVDDITSEYNLEKEAKIKTVKDANKLLIYTANITRDFVVDGNTSTYNQQVTNARRKYSDIISIHKGEKIFVDDRREVYRKLNRS
ncbi:MAG: PAS domain S-box protein, partial [Clostridia bacterium]